MTDAISMQRLRADVMHYASMGNHITGSSVDLATAEWIKDRLASAGFSVSLDPWPLRQFHLRECWVEICGRRLESFPLWHPKAMPKPFDAPLSDDPTAGDIALIQFSDVMVTPKSDHQKKIEAAAKAGAKAIIACTPHQSGEIYGQNVIPPHNQRPWPIPVLLIAPRDWHVLTDASTHRDKVRVCLLGDTQTKTRANNLNAKLKRGDRWIIISTPQSGWFRCAGERGAGIALLLALADWASASDLTQSFLFLSNSGHEIGHMGIHHVMEQGCLPSPEDTDCWLHLGSSIGARAFAANDSGTLQPNGPDRDGWLFGSEDMIPTLTSHFSAFDHVRAQVYDRNHGEIRWILEQGYRAFSLMGPQRFFHLASDGPENVDEALLSRLGDAIIKTLENKDNQDERSN